MEEKNSRDGVHTVSTTFKPYRILYYSTMVVSLIPLTELNRIFQKISDKFGSFRFEILHSTMVISSIRCPAPANLSMMKST